MSRGRWLGVVLLAVAASGCGLKGALYLPEKSDVTIRPPPAPAAPETPAQPPAGAATEAVPESQTQPEPPARDAPGGPARG